MLVHPAHNELQLFFTSPIILFNSWTIIFAMIFRTENAAVLIVCKGLNQRKRYASITYASTRVLTSIHIFPLFLFFSLFQFYSHPSAGKNSEHEKKTLHLKSHLILTTVNTMFQDEKSNLWNWMSSDYGMDFDILSKFVSLTALMLSQKFEMNTSLKNQVQTIKTFPTLLWIMINIFTRPGQDNYNIWHKHKWR